jgi:hypothetical protein
MKTTYPAVDVSAGLIIAAAVPAVGAKFFLG